MLKKERLERMGSKTAYDVIVVGGGPSGLMASIGAAQAGARVLLLDKGDKLGRKLAISGGGRCNVTNAKELDELIKMIPGNGRFLYGALNRFGNQEIISFFEGLGIALKEEDNGRMFPVSDKAKTVVDTLVKLVHQLGVEVRLNEPVSSLIFDDEQGRVAGVNLRSVEQVYAGALIIAVGGKSVPHTGSTGDGYAWAEAAGHTITTLFPTEVPLTSREPWIVQRELQGLSLRDIALTVWQAGNKRKAIKTHRGDMIFTHFGLSGPTVLRCSQYVVKEQMKNGKQPVLLTIDYKPDSSLGELTTEMELLFRSESKKAVKNVLKQVVPEKLIPLFLRMSNIDETTTFDHIPKAAWQRLLELLKEFPVYCNGTLSIEDAFITGGGVHLKEIDPRTMASKCSKGLYFCGEILDVHGYTGGYNITAAFSTGHAAGESAAEHAIGLRS